MPQESFNALAEELQDMATTVVTRAHLNAPDLRRVLSFIAKVTHVAEQAFQDVVAILIVGLLSHIQAMELIGQPRRYSHLRNACGFGCVCMRGSGALRADRPQGSRGNSSKLLIMPGFPEFGTNIELPALEATGKQDGFQLIFEIRWVRNAFR